MKNSFLARWNQDTIEAIYEGWKKDPSTVTPEWASFCEGFELGMVSLSQKEKALEKNKQNATTSEIGPLIEILLQRYRQYGHLCANLDPLTSSSPLFSLLEFSSVGLENFPEQRSVSSPNFRSGVSLSLAQLREALQQTYTQTLGVEYTHLQDPLMYEWLQERLEAPIPTLSSQKARTILEKLLQAELFENFLHTTYIGSKRFSLEGGESLLVALWELVEASLSDNVEEIILGMAHRGRLNILANLMQKPFRAIFNEFDEAYAPDIDDASGDVKYHLGYQTTHHNSKGETLDLFLAANPSHLEAVNGVVLGKTRARQRLLEDTEKRNHVIPILIHGDASFVGQGVVAETLNLSQLRGYRVGGTIHCIVNNQIGFTTLPADARSTRYCSDIAKFIEAPIFHVNGDDPYAVVRATQIAFEFRQRFARDVVIDIICYRRYGHNEGDEPSFTQPNLYSSIKKHPRVSEVFTKPLIQNRILTQEEIQKSRIKIEQNLETSFKNMKEEEQLIAAPLQQKSRPRSPARNFQLPYSFAKVKTAIDKKMLAELADALTQVPPEFRLLPKIRKNILEKRRHIFEAGGPYDWGYAETLAFGSLLRQDRPIRLSGQDSRRGTFSHRHSVFYDEQTRERYIPLQHLAADQESFCVYNSPLSEEAVLAFEYGYALGNPQMLVLWEAQFGDFANGAQVIIDQFLASAEAKWRQPCSLVMLLPHGYEGQGPEHSSARIERFLQLAAQENIEICIPSTPAQYFHLLRRQALRSFRKPLVIMTPKSLLRSPLATSNEKEFTSGSFQEIALTEYPSTPSKVKRLLFCCGKLYYDLLTYQEKEKLQESTMIIRIEQLYPLHEKKLEEIIAPFLKRKRSSPLKVIWAQEEPQNMGAYHFLKEPLEKITQHPLLYAGRAASASTAVGAIHWHRIEQTHLIHEAFTI